MIAEVIYGMLSSTADVTAIVGTGDNCRIFPVVADEGVRSPFITFNVINVSPDDSKSGAAQVDNIYVQVSCFGDSYTDTAILATKVRTALDRFTGPVGDDLVDGIRFEGFASMTEDETKVIYHIAQDFKVRLKYS
jgi:hypothetical protein